MEKITSFNKENLKMLRPEIQAVLDMIKDEYGVSFELGTIRFDETSFKMQVTASILAEGATSAKEARMATYEKSFVDFAKVYGFEKTDLHREFTSKGHVYMIMGLNFNKKKYGLVTRRDDGQIVNFQSDISKIINAQDRWVK